MKILRYFFLFMLSFHWLQAQNLEENIRYIEQKLSKIEAQKIILQDTLESLKLSKIQRDLKQLGNPVLRPGETLIEHAAFHLVYSEPHEQAAWVAHIIIPDVTRGNVSRSNDFRPDPLVETGTAVEKDYFLKYPKEDGQFEYDGFGYDRGHLAPSADFRWSQRALSESYFYSNMSPQVPELNRESWAELESIIRGYMFRHPNTQLYVVSGPVLHEQLPKIKRSVNQVSIPEQYFKVVLDLDHQRAIAFLMPNKKAELPLEAYAVAIDKVEALTGLDFFAQLADPLESHLEKSIHVKSWLPDEAQGDVKPLDPETLPPGHFNTYSALSFGKYAPKDKIKVCGTVVSTKLSGKGHIFLNLDKKFPKQIFTAVIWKDNVSNFSYPPHVDLKDTCICVEGRVQISQGTATMELKGEEAVSRWK